MGLEIIHKITLFRITDKHIAKLVILFFVFVSSNPAIADDQALAKLFAERNINGTIVISSLNSGKTFIHNGHRANLRFSPASTFKILNTLIALDEKVIAGENDVLKWDGHVYNLPDWNRNQTLASAFKVSCRAIG